MNCVKTGRTLYRSGADGKSFHVAFCGTTAAESKYPDCHSAYHFPHCRYDHLLCRVLHGVYAAGDSIDVSQMTDVRRQMTEDREQIIEVRMRREEMTKLS